MTISESQLKIWANSGSQAKFKDAHESIRKALNGYDWPVGVNYNVYLQGSYKNSTTTRSNSDVDVVVQLDSSFRQDLSRLSQSEKDVYHKAYSDATYHWDDFRYDVLNALRKQKSLTVNEGNKCIKVRTPYLDADVVVCMQHRLYENYNLQNKKFIEGMTFKSNGEWIVNYPKQHDQNGTLKSKNTNGNYYPTVRIFKNMKSLLVSKNIINTKEAPSYFIECLLYNVPNVKFGSEHGQTVYNILSYLNQQELSNFKCQNGIISLFGDSPDQWSAANARNFINKVVGLWNNW